MPLQLAAQALFRELPVALNGIERDLKDLGAFVYIQSADETQLHAPAIDLRERRQSVVDATSSGRGFTGGECFVEDHLRRWRMSGRVTNRNSLTRELRARESADDSVVSRCCCRWLWNVLC